MSGRPPEWTDKTIARLRQLRAEGLSTPIIAARLQTTKSAVCGKLHRLDLASRPSPPTRRAIAPADPSPPRSPRPTLPPSLTVVPPQPQRADQPPPPPPRRAPLPTATAAACCWPLGDPRTKSFRFCGDTAAPGRPYCPTHVARAYNPLSATRSA